MVCPKCGNDNVSVQTMSENLGTSTVTKTKSKYKEKGHGVLWWIFIGSWWWAVDLCIWIVAFFPRLILRLFAAPFKKKKYTGTSTTVSESMNKIKYRTICTCQNCGYHWEAR